MDGAANKKEYCEKTNQQIKEWYIQSSHKEDSKYNCGQLAFSMPITQNIVFGIRGEITPSDQFFQQIFSNRAPHT